MDKLMNKLVRVAVHLTGMNKLVKLFHEGLASFNEDITHFRFNLFRSSKSVLIMDLQVACRNRDIPCQSRGRQRSRGGELGLGLAAGLYAGQ